MTHTDNPNAAPEFNVGDVVCISATGRHQNMTGRIVEVQPNGACDVHIPRTDANGLASDVRIWYSASQLKSGNAADLKPASTLDISTRLEQRGLCYSDIVILVFSDIPHRQLFDARHRKGQSYEHMLANIERQLRFLREEIEELPGRSQLEESISSKKIGILNQILLANPRVGDVVISAHYIPHPDTHDLLPSLRIVALDERTQETREFVIAPDEFKRSVSHAEAMERGLKELRVWDSLWKGQPAEGLLNERPERGWPLFTQQIIPQLYEIMHPKYHAPPHHSEERDGTQPQRFAVAPKELVEDMLDILKTELPWVFDNGKYTPSALKAAINRYVENASLRESIQKYLYHKAEQYGRAAILEFSPPNAPTFPR